MFTGPEHTGTVYTLGLMAHFTMGALFGIVYAWLFGLFGLPASWLWGAIFGLVHGLVAGVFMGMMPAMHPRMGPGKPLPKPGFFGKNMSKVIPIGIVVLHIIFGAVLGALYRSTAIS